MGVDILVGLILYVAFGFLAVTMTPFALALNFGLCGAGLIMQHGVQLAEAMKRIDNGEAFSASFKGLIVFGGIAAFGTMWQFWAIMANSGMAWYFQILYLPATLADYFIGLL